MKGHGLSAKILTAFIAAAVLLGAAAAISAAFADRSWDSCTLAAQTRAAEIASASKAARDICSAEAALLEAFSGRDTAAAEGHIAYAKELMDGIEAVCEENKYLKTSESIKALSEASEELLSISEKVSEGDLPRAGKIFFSEYRPKLRAAAEYSERVADKLAADNGISQGLDAVRSSSHRLIIGIALLGISVILFFGLYIDTALRKTEAPAPIEEEPPQNDKYDTEPETDGLDFLSDKLSESESVIRTLVSSINTLADGDPDSCTDGIYPEGHSEALSAVRKMKARLRFISAQISRAAEFVSAESMRVSDNAEELSAAAEEQSTASEQLAECAEKMSGLISRSKELSDNIQKGEEECRSLANDCSQRLEESHNAMDSLRASLEELSTLAATAADIASRANLMAVSTAMHASKGDCSGASLAASADEARSLAIKTEEVSSQAAKIREDCAQAVSRTVTFMENTENSVRELESSLNGISADTEEISALNSEQSEAVTGASENLAKITGFVHLSKNAYEEYAASGRMLSEQTAALRKIMPIKQDNSE